MRPLQTSPFEIAYVHPSILCYRDKRNRKEQKLYALPFAPSLLLLLLLLFSFIDFALVLLYLSVFLSHSTHNPSIYGIWLAEWIDACVHALSRSGMTGERIQFPSSLSCLHLQLGLRSDHPLILRSSTPIGIPVLFASVMRQNRRCFCFVYSQLATFFTE